MPSYPPCEARHHLACWADEDTYFPLEEDMVWLREAGLDPDIVRRAGGLAVVAARRPPAWIARREAHHSIDFPTDRRPERGSWIRAATELAVWSDH